MSLEVGTNSYITVAEADSYFSTRFGSDSWTSLDESSKESALVSATQLLDSYCSWLGEPTDPEQALSFPRDGGTEVPQSIKDAECELAMSVIANDGLVETTSAALSALKAGDVQLNWNPTSLTTNSIYNNYVTSILNPYCDPTSSSNSASTAGVIRV